MHLKVVSLATFHPDTSELNILQPLNMALKLVALATFPELNNLQPLNMELKLVALATFHPDTSELNTLHSQNT
jgi:hypothetical protein